MNRVKLGFFSFSHLPDPDSYIEWHQVDHMPEQFRIPGIVWGQRFVATSGCRRASVVRADPLGDAGHLQYYLMDDPRRTLEEFVALGRELHGLGRLRTDITPCAQGSFQLLSTLAARRLQLSPEALPYRPNRGVYVVVEETIQHDRLDPWIRRDHEQRLPLLVDAPGVLGLWSFASTGAYGIPRSDLRITVLYLDGDPIRVAASLAPLLRARWHDAPVRPVLGGPFRAVIPAPVCWMPDDDQSECD